MNKILSYILVLALLFGCGACPVFAEESGLLPADPAPAASPSAIRFTDTDGHWAAASIAEWTVRGVLKGYPDGSFRPNGSVTLAELATMLCRIRDYPSAGGAECTGLKLSDWYYDSVSRLLAQRMLPVHGSFTETLTREDACYMIGRAFGLDKAGASGAIVGYSDLAGCSSYTLTLVKKMSACDIIHGYPDGSFRPKNSISRAEVVTLLTNAQKAADTDPNVDGQPALISGGAVFSNWEKTGVRLWLAMSAMADLGDGQMSPSLSFVSGDEAKQKALDTLKTRWNITDAAILKAGISGLADSGTDALFRMSVIELSQYNSSQLEALKSSSFMYEGTLELYDKWTSAGLTAYDALRAAQLSKLGYESGLLDYGDAFYLAGTAPQTNLKRCFGSWEEVWDNFLDGLAWESRQDIRGGKARSGEGRFEAIGVFYPDLFDDSLLK